MQSPLCHGGWLEHGAKHDNVYLLSAVPLTNSTPNFSHFGDTISTGVTAAIGIGIAFLLTMLHATSLIFAGQQPCPCMHCQHCFNGYTMM